MADDDPFGHIGADKAAAASDDPFAHIGARKPTVGEQVLDVAKQIPAGLAAGTAATLTFVPQMLGLLGPLANKYLPGDPEVEKTQAQLRALTAQARGGGIADYLPKPQTTAGEYARTASEFVPAAVAGRGSIPRAIGVATTAGLASEGAGQALKGDPLEPYARVVAALGTGHVSGKLAQGAATRASINEISQGAESAANRAYDQFRAAGFQLDPAAGATFTTPLKTALQRDGMTARTARNTWEVLDDIERTPFTNPVQLQERYKELGAVARNATTSPEERRAAGIAQERLLQLAENPPPWIVANGDPAAATALLREANANWAAVRRAENVSQRINAGELRAGSNYSGLNLENELRRRIGVLADPNVRGGFSPAEQQAFESFARGTPEANFRRYAKNLLGGGGGMGALAAGGAAAGIGSQFGLDPLTYSGLATLGGLGLAKYGNMRSLNRARELELMLLERSPYNWSRPALPSIQQPGGTTFLPALSARTLANLGEEPP